MPHPATGMSTQEARRAVWYGELETTRGGLRKKDLIRVMVPHKDGYREVFKSKKKIESAKGNDVLMENAKKAKKQSEKAGGAFVAVGTFLNVFCEC